jgi:hypothetical protein
LREVDALVCDVYISQETKQWLMDCHRQSDVVLEVYSAFALRFQKTRLLGRLYGKDANSPIKHLTDLDDLWEVRVQHPTGRYRLFFRFVRLEGRDAATFAGEGVVKKQGLLPRRDYDVASRRVDEYVSALSSSYKLRAADLMK